MDANIPTLTANELRWLAEEADGRRDEDFALIAKPDSDSRTPEGADAKKWSFVPKGSVPQDDVLLYVRTDGKIKKALLDVRLPGSKRPGHNYGEDFDALFWSEAAVTKFLRLYYSQLMTGEEYKEKIEAVFAKDEVLAMAHIPPSDPDKVEAPDKFGLHVVHRRPPELVGPEIGITPLAKFLAGER